MTFFKTAKGKLDTPNEKQAAAKKNSANVTLTKICCDGADKLKNNNRVLVTLPNFAEKNGVIKMDSAKPVVGRFEESEIENAEYQGAL